ncbi:MAG TPA: hypothetical protein DEQ61_19350, partial [Streptomyces sp.]|nr:hypothetical protein [Streptomyces sp.]
TAERATAWHGRRRAGGVVLHEASATVAAGECLAVVGRSGSGKTTLARCLAGLHRGWSGRVLLDGEPLPRSVRGRDREQLAAVQYVFQDARAAFDEYRPVAEQVARTAVRLRGTDPDTARSEALATLAGMGIGEETAGRRPGGLSGGELQRAALARALLARPRVLVCDEITSGLDAVSRRDICELLRRLTVTPSGGGTTGSRAAAGDTAGGGAAGGAPVDATAGGVATGLVLITHDLAVAAELADRIAVLDAGRIVEQGPAAELLSAPGHPFTRQLLAATGGVTVAV